MVCAKYKYDHLLFCELNECAGNMNSCPEQLAAGYALSFALARSPAFHEDIGQTAEFVLGQLRACMHDASGYTTTIFLFSASLLEKVSHAEDVGGVICPGETFVGFARNRGSDRF